MGEKSTFQTATEEQLTKWKAQIEEHAKKVDDLKARAEELELGAKLQYLEQIKQLENKIESVKGDISEGEQRLKNIKEAGEEAWEELKEGSQHAWDDLVTGVNGAWAEVKSSIDVASSKIHDRISPK